MRTPAQCVPARSAVSAAVFASLLSRLSRKLAVLRERSLFVRDTLAALLTCFLGQLVVLREATLLGRHVLTTLARDLPALLFIHRGSSAIASTTLVVCHVDLFCGIEVRLNFSGRLEAVPVSGNS